MNGITELFLMVSDLTESTEFYEETIGLEVIDRGSTVRFDAGGVTLVLEEDFDESVLSRFNLEPPSDERGDGAIMVIEVSDPDDVYNRAVDHGAQIVLEPRNVDWGRRIMLISDPDGYTLELSKPLKSDA